MSFIRPPSTTPSGVAGLALGAFIFAKNFAGGLKPDPQLLVSEWADERRMVAAESSPFPGQWRTSRTPYLGEPMDCLSPAHPSKIVTVVKGAQLGFTDAGGNFIGAMIDTFPGPAMVVSPTVDLVKAWGREKLDPMIKATPALRKKVRRQVAKSADGSTTQFKKFPGGFLVLTGANSSAGLQQRSIKFLIKEELSEWPHDTENRGDPSDMADERTTAFSDSCKIYQPSTPSTIGSCRITEAYEASDQRKFYLPCPHCGHEQVLEFERLQFSREYPHQAEYECAGPGCGALIQHHEKREMLAAGRWIAEAPGPGKQPGFWISQLYSPFVTWDDIAVKWIAAEGQPLKEKVFSQQVLGKAYKETGEAPEIESLYERREDYNLQTVPAGGLILTCGIDVGKDYFAYDVTAWGVGKTSWQIDYGKIEVTDTGDLAEFKVLDELLSRRYLDFNGKPMDIGQAAIDSGYRTQQVYAYVRSRPKIIAVKGRDGDNTAPIGKPSLLDVKFSGKVHKKGIKLYPVGTWPLKGELYANLRKPPPEDGDELYPIGYCHFCTGHTREYFEELTAEHLTTYQSAGRTRQRWVKTQDANHYLDTRVYAMAALEKLGASRWTFDDWTALAKARDAEETLQGDLLAYMRMMVPGAPTGDGTADDTPDSKPKPRARPKRRRRRARHSSVMNG